MAKLTSAQVYALAREVGLNPAAAAIATAIAYAESGLDPAAIGDEHLVGGQWGPSLGLWQIRSIPAEAGLGTPRDPDHLFDPLTNARAMAAISGTGTNWNAWSTFKNGAYRDHLGQVPATDAEMGAQGELINAGTLEGESVLDDLNPFTNWSGDALSIGLKLAVTVAAAALLVVGLARGVAA